MSENCTHDCSSCGEECPSRQNPESFLAPMNKMSNVKKVIGVVSGKGGVGKSSIAANIAYRMAKRNLKVGIIDADVYLSLIHI
mgnify:CR=1 FL=1